MNTKYELTDETMRVLGHRLRRIRPKQRVGPHAEAGELGGWIESENNLSRQLEMPGSLAMHKSSVRRKYLAMR